MNLIQKIEFAESYLKENFASEYEEYKKERKNNMFFSLSLKKSHEIFKKINPIYGITDKNAHQNIALFTGLAKWTESKIVYDVDPDFLDALKETKIDGVPAHYLQEFPFNSFMISTPYDFLSIYVFRESSATSEEVYFVYILDSIYTVMVVEGPKAVPNQMLRFNEASLLGDSPLDKNLFNLALMICAYILSEDSEVKPRQMTTKGKSLQQARIFDVGYAVGSAIRKYKYEHEKQDTDEPHLGGTVRPHLRKAHWHSYWTGKRSEPEKRRKIIKWIAPIFVNAEGPDDILPTVRKLK